MGLNLPKPPDLLHLYRDYGNHAIPITDTQEVSVMVTMDTEEPDTKVDDSLKEELVSVSHSVVYLQPI